MNELKMILKEVEIEDLRIKFILEADVDGDTYDFEKPVRLGKWNDEDKCLVEDEAAKERGLDQIYKAFDVTDVSELADKVGEEFDFWITDDGSVYFEEPTWYEERKLLDDLRENLSEIDPKLEGKSSKGVITHVHISKYKVEMFIEITGKNGNGMNVVSRTNFTKFNEATGRGKPDYKITQRQQAKLKDIFEINDINDLTTLVGETVIVNYEKVGSSGAMFVSCSGLDE